MSLFSLIILNWRRFCSVVFVFTQADNITEIFKQIYVRVCVNLQPRCGGEKLSAMVGKNKNYYRLKLYLCLNRSVYFHFVLPDSDNQ